MNYNIWFEKVSGALAYYTETSWKKYILFYDDSYKKYKQFRENAMIIISNGLKVFQSKYTKILKTNMKLCYRP